MSFQSITSKDVANHKATGFIDIYLPIAGHKAIKYWWNDEDAELGGFWEPWDVSIVAYETDKEAYAEAKMWAEADELPYVLHPELEK